MSVNRLDPEAAAARAVERERRWQRRLQLETAANRAVMGALATVSGKDRIAMSRALLAAATGAVAGLHDGACAQALLGQLAARYGGELEPPRTRAIRAAEKAFRGRA